MNEIREILDNYITIDLMQIVLSDNRNKDGATKIKIRPVMAKGVLVYQASVQDKTKVLHTNYGQDQIIDQITSWLVSGFKQMQMETKYFMVSALISKKGRVTVKEKKKQGDIKATDFSHNRKKRYVLEIGKPVPFLVDLGVMTADGQVVHSKYDKFRQINRYLEYIEDILKYLPQDRELTIIDFGCGKSYLTFAMYYYLKTLKGRNIKVIGLDLKEDVIRLCNELKDRYDFDKLVFKMGDIASYDDVDQVDMVVTLHACDTATDYALQKAVNWGAQVILAVPCCQHELNAQIHNDMLAPVLKYGLLKERMAALITDGLRAQLLETRGYSVQILEFIDMEHTPKNILIRAVKRDKKGQNKSEQKDDISVCLEELHIAPALEELLDYKRG